VKFSVQAAGYGPFTYQWYHNGNNVSGGNSADLYINNTTLSNGGSYYCRVCNADGHCVSSNTAQLALTGTYITKNKSYVAILL